MQVPTAVPVLQMPELSPDSLQAQLAAQQVRIAELEAKLEEAVRRIDDQKRLLARMLEHGVGSTPPPPLPLPLAYPYINPAVPPIIRQDAPKAEPAVERQDRIQAEPTALAEPVQTPLLAPPDLMEEDSLLLKPMPVQLPDPPASLPAVDQIAELVFATAKRRPVTQERRSAAAIPQPENPTLGVVLARDVDTEEWLLSADTERTMRLDRDALRKAHRKHREETAVRRFFRRS